MKNLFKEDSLFISITRIDTEELVIEMYSDFSGAERKSPLYVNEEVLVKKVSTAWKSIRTKKLLWLGVHFNEIDWYDNEIDVYTTPSVSIKRGLKIPRVSYTNHGSIPKDWEVVVRARIADTKAITPILEVITEVCGNLFEGKLKEDFIKGTRKVLQNKAKHCSVRNEE
jgi:hypothetical protein